MSRLNEFLQFRSLSLGIRVSPMCPMIGVVLRPIDIDIEPMLPIELELAKAVLMAPRIAIKALYHTSASHTRPVANLERSPLFIQEIDLFIFGFLNL
jgi:hypothetical protein